MIQSNQILNTVAMIQKENLDVRAVTMGINLLDCRGVDIAETCARVRAKIQRCAGALVTTCDAIGEQYAIPVVNKRISVTPIADVGAGFSRDDFVQLACALDAAATDVGCDLLGGFSANVERGISLADGELIAAIPEALSVTQRVCSSVNVGSTRYGINVDAIAQLGHTIKLLAERSAAQGGFAAAKFVVFTNQPTDMPFMAGAIHGVNQPEVVINVGVSGPGVVARALQRALDKAVTSDPAGFPDPISENISPLGLHDLADVIKRAAFRVTRCGELIGKQVARALGVPFGVVDLSLAPTPNVGDSVGEILKILGVDAIGAPGSTAIVALLNDAVKKGGSFASQSVGGLSGAFIPVCEDRELADAVKDGSLVLEKLEAMTSVCSVGLDMIAVPGSVDAATLAALIVDEMAIGMINSKTTAVRIIPVPGKEAGDFVAFGGLFGESAILPVRNVGQSSRFINFGGRIPAPIHSLRN
ncbi:MAG: PFL family protein [Anaerolineae bacterium]|nr:PFL family protein [Anaerolineae bacterium]